VELKAVQPHLFQQYFQEHGRDWKTRTRIGRLTNLRVFFNYAVEMDWLVKSPAAKKALSISKPTTHAREPFTHAEVKRIIDAIELLPEELRDRARALVLLMLYSGMRISDATFAQRASINAKGVLDFTCIKTRKRIGMSIGLNPVAVQALKNLPGSGAFFFQPEGEHDRAAIAVLNAGGKFAEALPQGVYKSAVDKATYLIVKVLALAGLHQGHWSGKRSGPRATEGACHRFRDTFAVNMLVGSDKGKADVFTVSKMLGHSDVKITANHYLNLVPGYRERMSMETRVLDYHLPIAG
jgi:integrase